MQESPLRRNARAAIALFDRLGALEAPVEAAAQAIARALLAGRKILAMGNGGSAADVGHFTTEFVGRFDGDRRPYPAINLAAHGGDLTAIGNDYAFVEIFERPILAFAQPGDIVLALSSSGNSENVIRGLAAAKRREAVTLALLGKGGGRTRGLADIEILVPADETARVQEAQKLVLHTICEMVEAALARA